MTKVKVNQKGISFDAKVIERKAAVAEGFNGAKLSIPVSETRVIGLFISNAEVAEGKNLLTAEKVFCEMGMKRVTKDSKGKKDTGVEMHSVIENFDSVNQAFKIAGKPLLNIDGTTNTHLASIEAGKWIVA